jgi:hypothetical protein
VHPSPRLVRVTSPLTNVLTSTHSPPTNSTKAPSPLSAGFCAPAGAWGTCCWSRSPCASHTARAASPACSVARRALALLTWIPTPSWIPSRAGSKGIQLARRASVSSPRGVNPPLLSPTCS